MAVADVTRLSAQLRNLQATINVLDSYYEGRQPLNYLDPRVAAAVNGRLRTLVVNWPRVIVGAIEDRLDVEGFRLAGSETANDDLWGIWQDNDLDEQSQLGHVDAMVHGHSFVSVWGYENDPTRPQIRVESAREMICEFYTGTNVVKSAVKRYVEGDEQIGLLLLPDRVERYRAPYRGDGLMWDETPPWSTPEVFSNPFGEVTIYPLVNRPRLARSVGESELTDVVPLADAVNKLATDMMVASEYHAMPRRWATGVDLGSDDERQRELVKQRWQQAEAGRIWLAGEDNVRFGQFSEASLGNFVEAIRMLATQIAALAGLPPHYLGVNTDNPASADAIRSSESVLVKKTQRKMRGFGGTWERAMRAALRVQGGALLGYDAPLPDGASRMETIWRDPETPTVAQKADAAVKLVGANLIHRDTALEDLGYTPTQIERNAERFANDTASTATADVDAKLALAQRLMDEQGLSQPAAYAAVGLLQAASQISSDGPT